MIGIIRHNKEFYLLWAITMIIVGAILPFTEKSDFSLWLNFRHTQAADYFFRYATWLGDGFVIGVICLILFILKLRWGIIASVGSFFSALFINLIKKEYNEPRPSVVLKNMDLHYVKGLDLYSNFSFPSGHTAAAFTLCVLLCYFAQDKRYTRLFFALAVIVAISRVYLLQHFLVDVYFGALLGTIFGTILLWPFIKIPLFSRPWSEIGILSGNRKV